MPEAAAATAEQTLLRLTAAISADTPCGPLPEARFDPAHEAFERSSNQQGQILACLRRLALGVRRPSEPMRVLSVGPGNGMLDLPLLESLAEAGVPTAYVGVDPSSVACQRFKNGWEAQKPRGVSLSVHECEVDDLVDDEGFDLIHAVHSLYYSADPPETIRRLLGRLRPGGRLAIFQAPRGELNALADCFWRADQGDLVWFSERLSSWLAQSEQPFERQRLEGRLEVTKALDLDDPHGRLVLDFILHIASGDLSDPVVDLAIGYLRSVSQQDGLGWFAPHPVDAFVVSPA